MGIPKKTFKDFLSGNDHLCSKCEKYVHRDIYSREYKLCNGCGINAELKKRLEEAMKPKKKPTVVDRGVDEILLINEKEVRIDNLSANQLIHLLNGHGLTDIKMVSFDEYEQSIKK